MEMLPPPVEKPQQLGYEDLAQRSGLTPYLERSNRNKIESRKLGFEIFKELFSAGVEAGSILRELKDDEPPLYNKFRNEFIGRILGAFTITEIDDYETASMEVFFQLENNWGIASDKSRAIERKDDILLKAMDRAFVRIFAEDYGSLLTDFANALIDNTSENTDPGQFLFNFLNNRNKDPERVRSDLDFILTRFSSIFKDKPIRFRSATYDPKAIQMHLSRPTTGKSQPELRNAVREIRGKDMVSAIYPLLENDENGNKPSKEELRENLEYITGGSSILGERRHAKILLKQFLDIDIDNPPEGFIYTVFDLNQEFLARMGLGNFKEDSYEFYTHGPVASAHLINTAFHNILMSENSMRDFILFGLFPKLGVIKVPIESVFTRNSSSRRSLDN